MRRVYSSTAGRTGVVECLDQVRLLLRRIRPHSKATGRAHGNGGHRRLAHLRRIEALRGDDLSGDEVDGLVDRGEAALAYLLSDLLQPRSEDQMRDTATAEGWRART